MFWLRLPVNGIAQAGTVCPASKRLELPPFPALTADLGGVYCVQSTIPVEGS